MSLALRAEPFDDFSSRAYFDNLLQERDGARRDIIARYRLANDDVVGILADLGVMVWNGPSMGHRKVPRMELFIRPGEGAVPWRRSPQLD